MVTILNPEYAANRIILGDYAFFGPNVKFTWLCLKL